MAEVIVFHHALGLTEGIETFADGLRAAGHTVETPDLFDGRRWTDVEAGVAHAEGIGFSEIGRRGVAAAEVMGDGFVAVGFSLGAVPAQMVAQTRSGVAGVVLCHSVVPPSSFGDGWPASVGVQIHLATDDPWAAEDMSAAEELAGMAAGELHLYPTAAHLVAEVGHDDHDATIAALITERILAFLTASTEG